VKLSFGNVKGRSGEYLLPAVSVVVGENFSGKSAILTALRLALIGYDPALGKTPGATWQLSGGTEMSVSLWKDATTHCRRTWKLAKGSVTKDEQCSTWNIPAALVDVREFLGMPAKKRAEYILGIVPVAEAAVSPARLRAEIPVEHLNPEVTDFLEFWEGDRQEHGTAAGPWLANLCEQAAVKARESAAAAKEAEAAMRQFVADIPVLGVADQTAEIARIEAEIDRLTREDAAHRGAQQAIAGLANDKRLLESLAQELVAQSAALAACEVSPEEAASAGKAAAELGESLRAARQSLEQAQAQRKKLGRTGKCPTCGCEAVKLGAKLDREIAKHGAAVAELEPKLAAAESVLGRVRAAESIEAKAAALEPRIADLKSRASVATAYDEQAHAAVSKALSDEQYRLSKTRANHHQWVKVQERRRLQAKIEASATANKAEAATWNEVAKALKRVRDEAVSAAFGDFADRIEQFTTGILPWQLQVHDGDLGYFTDGTWVSHEVFSGSEMALVYAGLGVALAGDASVKIVMMDEVLISDDNKRKIADRMLALAKQGVIDAFIIVDVTEAGWPTWCDVIRTGEEVPA
jgi:hypothetical protein